MKKENLEKIKYLKDHELIYCKCTLQTCDEGKTWGIEKVFYTKDAHTGKFIEESELAGLSLITE